MRVSIWNMFVKGTKYGKSTEEVGGAAWKEKENK